MLNKLLTLITTALLLTTSVQAVELKHVEPSHWWVNMTNQELQLLLHGEHIAQYQVVLSDPEIKVLKVHKTDNPNYLFVDLDLSKKQAATDFDIELWQGKRQVSRYNYQLQERQSGSKQRQGFSAKDVIYLITPDRFVNGDSSNDQVASMKEGIQRQLPGGRHGGDIQGVIDSLEYIADMGFSQIWLNPVLENDMASYSYHGYSTTDYYQVDPRYGSNELYLSLSEQAKAKGIGLIKDIILNHIGSEHWWMKDLPAKDWINNEAKFIGTTHLREALHDPYATTQDKVGFTDGWFVPTMPDLNQRNPLLAKYLIQNSIWWVEYAGLSGIRLDTYSYPDKAFLADWNNALLAEYPKLNIVGEEWTLNPAITAYWQKGSKRYDDYDSQLPSVFDFSLQDAIVQSLTQDEKWNTGWIKTYTSLANDFLYGDPYNLVIFPDNHDMTRIYNQLNEDPALTKMALAFYATTRGIPQIYYGTEILMSGVEDHGVIRSDFPGGWSGDKANAFTQQGLTAEQIDTQNYLKQLLNWRKTSAAITSGKLVHYNRFEQIYSYFRIAPGQDEMVLVLLNKANKVQQVDLSRFKQVLKGKNYIAKDVLTGQQFKLGNAVDAKAKAATILELKIQ